MIDPNIKAHVLDDLAMKEAGFTNHVAANYYYCVSVGAETTYNLTIRKDGSRFKAEVLDEMFMQHYPFEYLLSENPTHQFALDVAQRVDEVIRELQNKGIISGYTPGTPAIGIH